MSRSNGGTVFKSASTSVLRPMGGRSALEEKHREELDPLQAVLNHSWNKATASADAGKRTGIARRGLQAEMGGLSEKAAAFKAADKAGPGEGIRSRLGQTGTSLFVETGAKTRLTPTFDEDSPPAQGDASPPTSPGDKPSGRIGKKAGASAPVRRYQNDVCPNEDMSPKMRSPPRCRKGQVKLNYEGEAAAADAEHAQSVVDDHKPHLDPEQEHFVDICHHFLGACNQAGVRLCEMLTKVRRHFMEDPSWLEAKLNFNQLTELAFEIQTANYFIAKWHHELEPRKVQAPVRPTKLEDMSAEDILAQSLYSTSKLEVLAGKLGPVLEKICYDAKTLRRGANGEPLTPTSKNALTLAKKRGFIDVAEFNNFIGHLEHVLSVTQHLASPPVTGLPKLKKMATIMNAIGKFKRGLSMKKSEPQSPTLGETPTSARDKINDAFGSLGASVAAKAAEAEANG